ncbi:MAG: MerR family transcriptional regulator [Bacteroidales bacterium]|nr:MerR family transcriptional regulator [Bacteroidales bacterium]
MKLYYSIKEVAEMLNVNTSLLRFWESEFPQLKPNKTTGGARVYTEKDIALVREIYRLTKECGFTLDGARQQLKSQGRKAVQPSADDATAIEPSAPSTEKAEQLESALKESTDRAADLQKQIDNLRERRDQAIASLRQARQQLEDLKTSLQKD